MSSKTERSKRKREQPSGKGKKGVDKDANEDEARKERKIPQNHKEQKELRIERKKESNPMFTLVQNVKPKWEKARHRDTSNKDRGDLVKTITKELKTHLHDIIFQHDSARIIQFCFHHGTKDVRATIFEELKDHLKELSKSKYSKFVIPVLLQYGTKDHRAAILASFKGEVRKVIKHATAGPILDTCFLSYANAEQRSALLEEFYGPQFAVFKKSREDTLEKVFTDHPDKKPKILRHMRQTLVPVLGKQCADLNIVHRVLREYLENAEPKDTEEVLELIKDIIVEMLHTRDGARVAMYSLWNGSVKERKAIIRSFKPYVPKICQEEYGHAALLAAFECVDDTVLLKKNIIAEIQPTINDIMLTKPGRKVLLHLLSPRDPKYLDDNIRKVLALGDNNPHSKKDSEKRHTELIQAASPMILAAVAAQIGELSADGPGSQLVFETCVRAEGDKTDIIEALSQAVEEHGLMDSAPGHRLLKNLIKGNLKGQTGTFALNLAKTLKASGSIATYAETNRAAFVLTSILESSDKEAKKIIEAGLKPVAKELKKSKLPGVVLLKAQL